MIKKIVIGTVVTLVALLIICLVPLKEVAYTVTVDYQDTETYYVDEPYKDTETYTETVPIDLDYEVTKSYVDKDTYTYQWHTIIGGIEGGGTREVPFPIGCVVVKNTDNVSGTFNVHFSFYSVTKTKANFYRDAFGEFDKEDLKGLGDKYTDNNAVNLEPGETETAKFAARDIDMDRDEWFWEYEITQGTEILEKQRTVTKYRQVEKQRTVTKQRPETRYKKETLLDYWLHY